MKKYSIALALLATPALAFAFTETTPFTIGSGSSTFVTVTNAGNVGLGTASPEFGLSVAAANINGAPSTAGIHLGNSSGFASMQFFNTSGTLIDFSATAGRDFDFRQIYLPSTNTYTFNSSSTNPILTLTGGGNVGVGTGAPQTSLDVRTAATAVLRGITSAQTSADTNGAFINLMKSRGAASLQNGDGIGSLAVQAFDGTNYINSSRIKFVANGTVAAGSVPTDIQFLTGASGGGSERMRIDSAGKISFFGAPGTVGSIIGTPRIVASFTDSRLGVHSEALAVSGRYAYTNDFSGDGMNIIDIADPLNPVIVGRVQDHVHLQSAEDITVAGHYAYIVTELDNVNWFTIVDVENPKNPVVVGSVNDARLFGGEDTYVSGKYAYVSADTGHTFSVIDVSNPASPTIVGSITDATLLNNVEGVWVTGRYAYVANEEADSLSVIDVVDPTHPVIVGNVQNHTLLDGASGIYVDGRYAYVSAPYTGTMAVVDISTPATPVIVGSVTNTSLLMSSDKLMGAGKYVYVTSSANDTLVMVDVSTPSSPFIAASLQDSRLASPIGVQVDGRYAYVVGSAWQHGTPSFNVIELPGLDISTISAGDIQTASLKTWDNLEVGNSLFVRNGGNFGSGGVYANGPGAFTSLCINGDCRTAWPIPGGAAPSAPSAPAAAPLAAPAASTGSSPWTLSGSNMYYNNGGNVGIGNTNPGYKLDVTGSTFMTNITTGGPNSYTMGNASSLDKGDIVLGPSTNRHDTSILMWSATGANRLTSSADRFNFDAWSNGVFGQGAFIGGIPGGPSYFSGNVGIGSAGAPKGITLYDTANSAPYCLTVTSGVVSTTAGACAN